jgi:hypothetical protein
LPSGGQRCSVVGLTPADLLHTQVIKAVLLHGMASIHTSHGAVPPLNTLRTLAAEANVTLLGDTPPTEASPASVQVQQSTQLLVKATTAAAAHVVKVRHLNVPAPSETPRQKNH